MSFLKEKIEDKAERALAPLLPIPAFGDLSKAANDVCISSKTRPGSFLMRANGSLMMV
jgi:hypothetical protein